MDDSVMLERTAANRFLRPARFRKTLSVSEWESECRKFDYGGRESLGAKGIAELASVKRAEERQHGALARMDERRRSFRQDGTPEARERFRDAVKTAWFTQADYYSACLNCGCAETPRGKQEMRELKAVVNALWDRALSEEPGTEAAREARQEWLESFGAFQFQETATGETE